MTCHGISVTHGSTDELRYRDERLYQKVKVECHSGIKCAGNIILSAESYTDNYNVYVTSVITFHSVDDLLRL